MSKPLLCGVQIYKDTSDAPVGIPLGANVHFRGATLARSGAESSQRFAPRVAEPLYTRKRSSDALWARRQRGLLLLLTGRKPPAGSGPSVFSRPIVSFGGFLNA